MNFYRFRECKNSEKNQYLDTLKFYFTNFTI